MPSGTLRITDEAGRDRPAGEPGEIRVGGPMVVPGYWGAPEATARAFEGGEWRSGDVGSLDADGFVRVLDRLKDVINRGGHKVWSAEVEGVLAAHPDVAEAAVIPVPCAVLGERVHAVVVPRGAAPDPDALRAHCAARLSDYKVPEAFAIRAEPLPRNPGGKVVKTALRTEKREETS